MLKKLYENDDLIFCVKPYGVVSQDDNRESCMPSMIKKEFGIENIYTVHRLDVKTGGVMVYAKNQVSAAEISREIQDDKLVKEYLAVVYGTPDESFGVYDDLLFWDSSKRKSYVVKRERKGVKHASLEYNLLETCCTQNGKEISLIKIKLNTGRTHQIRVQFASRGMPVFGDRKYGAKGNCDTFGLWSYRITLSGKKETISAYQIPENIFPWNLFQESINNAKL